MLKKFERVSALLSSRSTRFMTILTATGLASAFFIPNVPKAALADDTRWYLIRSKHSDQCLNILGGSYENGALATQGVACDTPNFLWRFVSVTRSGSGSTIHHIIARHSDQCLNVLNGSEENGAPVVQGSACDTQNFGWYLVRLDDGYYHIVNQQTGQCLNVLGGSFDNGARVVQGVDCDTPNFEWRIERAL